MSLLMGTLVMVLLALPVSDAAAGISIDAGLTPPEGRWILRSQFRAMSREGLVGMGTMRMERRMVPLVAVHGVSPDLTMGLRQIVESRTMTINGVETNTSGLSDLYVFAKYKVLRINTRSYTLGIAPVLGIEPPTGADGISSESWDLNTGLYVSGRAGAWGMDLNMVYGFRGVAGLDADAAEPGDEIAVDLAFVRQFSLGASDRIALAPVLEVSWSETGSARFGGVDAPNTGESVLSLAPGMKYTLDDVIIEVLIRVPVSQKQTGLQTEIGTMALMGVRYMF